MQRPAVMLSTTSRMRTSEEQIPVLIKFVKPVFGFNSSHVSISGGQLQRLASPFTLIFLSENIFLFLHKLLRITSLLSDTTHGSLIYCFLCISSFQEMSRSMYTVNIQARDDFVSVSIPENVTGDVAGNGNLQSNILRLKHCNIIYFCSS